MYGSVVCVFLAPVDGAMSHGWVASDDRSYDCFFKYNIGMYLLKYFFARNEVCDGNVCLRWLSHTVRRLYVAYYRYCSAMFVA